MAGDERSTPVHSKNSNVIGRLFQYDESTGELNESHNVKDATFIGSSGKANIKVNSDTPGTHCLIGRNKQKQIMLFNQSKTSVTKVNDVLIDTSIVLSNYDKIDVPGGQFVFVDNVTTPKSEVAMRTRSMHDNNSTVTSPSRFMTTCDQSSNVQRGSIRDQILLKSGSKLVHIQNLQTSTVEDKSIHTNTSTGHFAEDEEMEALVLDDADDNASTDELIDQVTIEDDSSFESSQVAYSISECEVPNTEVATDYCDDDLVVIDTDSNNSETEDTHVSESCCDTSDVTIGEQESIETSKISTSRPQEDNEVTTMISTGNRPSTVASTNTSEIDSMNYRKSVAFDIQNSISKRKLISSTPKVPHYDDKRRSTFAESRDVKSIGNSTLGCTKFSLSQTMEQSKITDENEPPIATSKSYTMMHNKSETTTPIKFSLLTPNKSEKTSTQIGMNTVLGSTVGLANKVDVSDITCRKVRGDNLFELQQSKQREKQFSLSSNLISPQKSELSCHNNEYNTDESPQTKIVELSTLTHDGNNISTSTIENLCTISNPIRNDDIKDKNNISSTKSDKFHRTIEDEKILRTPQRDPFMSRISTFMTNEEVVTSTKKVSEITDVYPNTNVVDISKTAERKFSDSMNSINASQAISTPKPSKTPKERFSTVRFKESGTPKLSSINQFNDDSAIHSKSSVNSNVRCSLTSKPHTPRIDVNSQMDINLNAESPLYKCNSSKNLRLTSNLNVTPGRTLNKTDFIHFQSHCKLEEPNTTEMNSTDQTLQATNKSDVDCNVTTAVNEVVNQNSTNILQTTPRESITVEKSQINISVEPKTPKAQENALRVANLMASFATPKSSNKNNANNSLLESLESSKVPYEDKCKDVSTNPVVSNSSLSSTPAKSIDAEKSRVSFKVGHLKTPKLLQLDISNRSHTCSSWKRESMVPEKQRDSSKLEQSHPHIEQDTIKKSYQCTQSEQLFSVSIGTDEEKKLNEPSVIQRDSSIYEKSDITSNAEQLSTRTLHGTTTDKNLSTNSKNLAASKVSVNAIHSKDSKIFEQDLETPNQSGTAENIELSVTSTVDTSNNQLETSTHPEVTFTTRNTFQELTCVSNTSNLSTKQTNIDAEPSDSLLGTYTSTKATGKQLDSTTQIMDSKTTSLVIPVGKQSSDATDTTAQLSTSKKLSTTEEPQIISVLEQHQNVTTMNADNSIASLPFTCLAESTVRETITSTLKGIRESTENQHTDSISLTLEEDSEEAVDSEAHSEENIPDGRHVTAESEDVFSSLTQKSPLKTYSRVSLSNVTPRARSFYANSRTPITGSKDSLKTNKESYVKEWVDQHSSDDSTSVVVDKPPSRERSASSVFPTASDDKVTDDAPNINDSWQEEHDETPISSAISKANKRMSTKPQTRRRAMLSKRESIVHIQGKSIMISPIKGTRSKKNVTRSPQSDAKEPIVPKTTRSRTRPKKSVVLNTDATNKNTKTEKKQPKRQVNAQNTKRIANKKLQDASPIDVIKNKRVKFELHAEAPPALEKPRRTVKRRAHNDEEIVANVNTPSIPKTRRADKQLQQQHAQTRTVNNKIILKETTTEQTIGKLSPPAKTSVQRKHTKVSNSVSVSLASTRSGRATRQKNGGNVALDSIEDASSILPPKAKKPKLENTVTKPNKVVTPAKKDNSDSLPNRRKAKKNQEIDEKLMEGYSKPQLEAQKINTSSKTQSVIVQIPSTSRRAKYQGSNHTKQVVVIAVMNDNSSRAKRTTKRNNCVSDIQVVQENVISNSLEGKKIKRMRTDKSQLETNASVSEKPIKSRRAANQSKQDEIDTNKLKNIKTSNVSSRSNRSKKAVVTNKQDKVSDGLNENLKELEVVEENSSKAELTPSNDKTNIKNAKYNKTLRSKNARNQKLDIVTETKVPLNENPSALSKTRRGTKRNVPAIETEMVSRSLTLKDALLPTSPKSGRTAKIRKGTAQKKDIKTTVELKYSPKQLRQRKRAA